MKLKLESINQNNETKISFSIDFLDQKEEQGQTWQYYKLKLKNGSELYEFNSIDKEAISNVGTVAQVGKFAFAIKPHNELETFAQSLEKFINSDHKTFRFEPSDPSFELIIERLSEINNEKNFKVYFWVDAGNTKALEYTWDSVGIRFISNLEKLRVFTDNLDQQSQN